MIDISKEEDKAIKSLQRLSKRWPKSLWLYSASGTLCVMKGDENGGAIFNERGSIDSEYVVATIDIPNDGGDF